MKVLKVRNIKVYFGFELANWNQASHLCVKYAIIGGCQTSVSINVSYCMGTTHDKSAVVLTIVLYSNH